MSYLEIYNEKIHDLLGDDEEEDDEEDYRRNLKIRENQGIFFVEDLTFFVVESSEDMMEIMDRGKTNRAVGSTDMNQESSRSHAILTVIIERQQKDNHIVVSIWNASILPRHRGRTRRRPLTPISSALRFLHILNIHT